MESNQSVPWDSPLACIKRNLKPLLLTDLKVHKLKSLCTQSWPQYKVDNQNHWPEFGTFDFNILSDLTNLLKQNGNCSEVPCAEVFWDLQSRPSLCTCSTHEVLLCTLPLKQKGSSSSTNRQPRPSATPEFDPADEPPLYLPPCQPSPPPHPTHLLAPNLS